MIASRRQGVMCGVLLLSVMVPTGTLAGQETISIECESENILGLQRTSFGVFVICKDRLLHVSEGSVSPFHLRQPIDAAVLLPDAAIVAIRDDALGFVVDPEPLEVLVSTPLSGMKLALAAGDGMFIFGGERGPSGRGVDSPVASRWPEMDAVYWLGDSTGLRPVAALPVPIVDVVGWPQLLLMASEHVVYRFEGDSLSPFFADTSSLEIRALDYGDETVYVASGRGLLAINGDDAKGQWLSSDPTDDVAWTPNGVFMLNREERSLTVLWPGRHGIAPFAASHPSDWTRAGVLNVGSSFLTSLEFHPAGKWLATASGDSIIHIWDLNTFGRVQTQVSGGYHVSFSRDGRFLASGGLSHIDIWDLSTWTRTRTLQGGLRSAPQIIFNPTSSLLASYDAFGLIILWDTQSWVPVITLQVGAPLSRIAFSPDGRLLATVGAELKVWNLLARREVWSDPGQPTGCPTRPIAFSPDSRWLVVAQSVTITVRDADTGSVVRRFPAADEGFCTKWLGFTPDGRWFAAAIKGGSGDVGSFETVWSTDTWQRARNFENRWGWGTAFFTFSGDGRWMASYGYEGSTGERVVNLRRTHVPAEVVSGSELPARQIHYVLPEIIRAGETGFASWRGPRAGNSTPPRYWANGVRISGFPNCFVTDTSGRRKFYCVSAALPTKAAQDSLFQHAVGEARLGLPEEWRKGYVDLPSGGHAFSAIPQGRLRGNGAEVIPVENSQGYYVFLVVYASGQGVVPADLPPECRTAGQLGGWEGTFEQFYRGTLGCTNGVWVAPVSINGNQTSAFGITADELLEAAAQHGWSLRGQPTYLPPSNR